MPHALTKDQLVEQPAIGLFAELGWITVSTVDEIGPFDEYWPPAHEIASCNMAQVRLSCRQ